MGQTTIGWTSTVLPDGTVLPGYTWNPWMGCQRVSPGCEHCYAETLVAGRMKLPVWGPPSTTERKRTSTATWKNPAAWHRAALKAGVRRRMFVASLADVFEDHPDIVPWRAEALAILAQCTALDVQLLTKRPENVLRMVPETWLKAWPRHVWIGTTVEDQRRADERIPELLKVPAAVRFLSCEPLLERVDLSPWLSADETMCPECDGFGEDVSTGESCVRCESGVGPWERVSWVIVGGESGPGARPCAFEWVRSIVAQCREAGVAAFVKQGGDHATLGFDVAGPDGVVRYGRPEGHPDLDEARATPGYTVRRHRLPLSAHHGADPSEWPEDLRVQEFPEVPCE